MKTTFNTIEEIFETAEFKAFYDHEQEIKDLAECGWTMKMVRDFANGMAKQIK